MAESGASDHEIAHATGIPHATVRNYRTRLPVRVRLLRNDASLCGRCGSAPHDFSTLVPATYAYVLGIYLGDGCLAGRTRTYRLQVSLDSGYPGIVAEVAHAVGALRGKPPSAKADSHGKACTTVYSSWKSWACFLPQHGSGRKHTRELELLPWQQTLVDQAPGAFLRGLIHSDGCRVINRFETRLPSGRVATYEYPRYFFSNLSADIRRMFCETCDQLGIRWTRSNHRNISVSHRHAVARLDEFIGPKF